MVYIESFLERVNRSRIYRILTGILFPLILIVFCFIKVNKGLDITDSAFNPYNYLHIDSLSNTWFYSYLYTNLLGAFFSILPLGKTMLGMNIYTGLVKLALALVAYFVMSGPVKVRREYAFLGSFIALGLCWCPTTVMYNYLTYLLFLAGTLLLYLGLVKSRNILLIFAGFVLGSNVFARFPNVCEAGLIAALWYYSFLKKEKFGECLKKTLLCLAGYAGGLAVGFIIIAFTHGGIAGFFDGIIGLFGMTKEATGYKPTGMLTGIVNAYRFFWPYTEKTIIFLLLCTLVSLVFPHKLNWLRHVLITLIIPIMLFLHYRGGLFSFGYTNYGSIYGPGVLLTEISLLFPIVFMILKSDADDKLLAMLCVLTVFITPLGTNNALYANINYGFFTIPVLLYLLSREEPVGAYFRPLNYALFLIVCFVLIQSTGFGAKFVFRDGDGIPMDTRVEGSKAVSGMYTTKAHAAELEGLFKYMSEVRDDADGMFLYGNVSGLGFYLEDEICIGFAWPALDSYPIESFKADIDNLVKTGRKPLIIIGDPDYMQISTGTELNAKQTILKEFLGNNGYDLGYYNERLVVLNADRNGD